MHFYLAIILFITSVVAGIVAMIAVKEISKPKISMAVAIHFIFLILNLFTLSNKSGPDNIRILNLSFLFFICSGIILFGITWQQKINIIIKIYFSLFALTLLMVI